MLYAVFLGEMCLLYILSRMVNEKIYLLSFLLTESRMIAITVITLLFFPGTVIHELAHLFVAEILGVHTGKLSLIPKEIEEEYIQAGSVEIAKTDPFRRTVIGLAPIFVGIVVITLLSIQLSKMAPKVWCQVSSSKCQEKSLNPSTIQPLNSSTSHPLTTDNRPASTQQGEQFTTVLFVFLGYLLLSISNNMFSSKEDLIGVPPVLIFIAFILIISYIVGLRIQLTGDVLKTIEYIVSTINSNIVIVLLINAGLLLFLWGLIWGVKKVKRLR